MLVVLVVVLYIAIGIIVNGVFADFDDEFSMLILIGWPLAITMGVTFCIMEKLYHFGRWIKEICKIE